MYGSMGVKKNLTKMLKGVRLENLALISDKGRVPAPVASHKTKYSIDEVSDIAGAAMKYDAKYGGLEEGMTREKLTRALISEPRPYHNFGVEKYVVGIFTASIVGLLGFANYVPTGAVIGSGSVGVALKLVAGVAVVLAAFFLFKIFKKKK